MKDKQRTSKREHIGYHIKGVCGNMKQKQSPKETELEKHIKRNHYNEAMIEHILEVVRIDRIEQQKQFEKEQEKGRVCKKYMETGIIDCCKCKYEKECFSYATDINRRIIELKKQHEAELKSFECLLKHKEDRINWFSEQLSLRIKQHSDKLKEIREWCIIIGCSQARMEEFDELVRK